MFLAIRFGPPDVSSRPGACPHGACLHAFHAADDIDRHAALRVVPDYTTLARIRAGVAVAARYVTGGVSAARRARIEWFRGG